MLYRVYTDGSGSDLQKIIGAAYLILTEDTYICHGSATVRGIDNPTYAETIAVGLAAQDLLDSNKLTKEDEIVFYIDCVSTIKFCKKLCKRDPEANISSIPLVKASITIVRELCKTCKVSFEKVRSHQDKVNPNTFVDKLAKFCIRR